MTAVRALKKPLKKNLKSKHKATGEKKKTVKASAKPQLRVVKSKKTHRPNPAKPAPQKVAKQTQPPAPPKPAPKAHPFANFMQQKSSFRPHAPNAHFHKHEFYRKKAI